jgi:multidrug efflux pump subunit AcrB
MSFITRFALDTDRITMVLIVGIIVVGLQQFFTFPRQEDPPIVIRDRLYEQTLVIVLSVVMLFLGIRTGLVVGSFVPMTMLMGLVILRLVGVELERISIASAIIALGMLVDNGIVVAEKIRARLERGQERREACIEAGRTLAIPLSQGAGVIPGRATIN